VSCREMQPSAECSVRLLFNSIAAMTTNALTSSCLLTCWCCMYSSPAHHSLIQNQMQQHHWQPAVWQHCMHDQQRHVLLLLLLTAAG
jgi:hypothetical protein